MCLLDVHFNLYLSSKTMGIQVTMIGIQVPNNAETPANSWFKVKGSIFSTYFKKVTCQIYMVAIYVNCLLDCNQSSDDFYSTPWNKRRLVRFGFNATSSRVQAVHANHKQDSKWSRYLCRFLIRVFWNMPSVCFLSSHRRRVWHFSAMIYLMVEWWNGSLSFFS